MAEAGAQCRVCGDWLRTGKWSADFSRNVRTAVDKHVMGSGPWYCCAAWLVYTDNQQSLSDSCSSGRWAITWAFHRQLIWDHKLDPYGCLSIFLHGKARPGTTQRQNSRWKQTHRLWSPHLHLQISLICSDFIRNEFF